jgi:hypothetical protein
MVIGYTLCLDGSTMEEYRKFFDWYVEGEIALDLMLSQRHLTPGDGFGDIGACLPLSHPIL